MGEEITGSLATTLNGSRRNDLRTTIVFGSLLFFTWKESICLSLKFLKTLKNYWFFYFYIFLDSNIISNLEGICHKTIWDFLESVLSLKLNLRFLR